MEFGSTVSRLRKGRGWSKAKLASKAGVSSEVIDAWESGKEFPSQGQLLSLAGALKVKISRLIEGDEELMVQVIDSMEVYETVIMAVVSTVTLVCTLALIAVSSTMPSATQAAAHVTEVVLALGLVILMLMRRTPSATRARSFRDALEASDGSQANFILTRRAGRNTRNVVMQFVLGAVIALTLITLLGVIVPESRLPWVMF